jgi:hypothetical protein
MRVVISDGLKKLDCREMSCDEATGFIRLMKEVDMVSFGTRMFRPGMIYLDLSNSREEVEVVEINMEEQNYGK